MHLLGWDLEHPNYLKFAFPEHWQAILSVRNSDPLIEELCVDIEQVCADLEWGNCEPGKMSPGLRSDYDDSLRALQQETRDHFSGSQIFQSNSDWLGD